MVDRTADPKIVSVLQEAENALRGCYEVTSYPADGSSRQASALQSVRMLLEELTAPAPAPLTSNERVLREALECLLPGLILDLRYASENDDRDAMRSRIKTVTDALTSTAAETTADAAWIIWFEDADRKPEVFTGHGATECARRRFEQISHSWNAHLFQRVTDNTRPAQKTSDKSSAPSAADRVAAEPSPPRPYEGSESATVGADSDENARRMP